MTHHLLVVDDDPAIRRMLTHLLEAEGYAVQTAMDGSDALSVIEAGQPDLLLVDLQMPGMGGLELLSRLSDLAVVPPSIVISGQLDGRRLAERAGAVEFIAKPFEVDELLEAVASLLDAPPRAPRDKSARFSKGYARLAMEGVDPRGSSASHSAARDHACS